MSLKQVSPFLRAWYKWKTLRLPWRRQVLAGVDLKGNTYWELRDPRAAEVGRVRRMVRYPRSTHYAEVTVSPAWHQWLRHTRVEPPSVDEQRNDLLRQERIKVLAAQADARWEAKPSYLDPPDLGQAVPLTRSPRTEDATKTAGTLSEHVQETMSSGNRPDEEVGSDKKESWGVSQEEEKKKEKALSGKSPAADDPWERARGPGENWQPKGWDPAAASKR